MAITSSLTQNGANASLSRRNQESRPGSRLPLDASLVTADGIFVFAGRLVDSLWITFYICLSPLEIKDNDVCVRVRACVCVYFTIFRSNWNRKGLA